MFQRILVPLDGSPLAERALPYVGVLARSTGASVSLVHPAHMPQGVVWDCALPSRSIAEAEGYLAQVARTFDSTSLRVETSVPVGDPQEAVVDTLHHLRPDLVVLPLPLHAGLGRWVGIAERVLADTAQPTLLVPTWGAAGRRETHDEPVRIVVPLNGSATAEAALPFAAALARHLRGDIVLLRVVSPLPLAVPAERDARWNPERIACERICRAGEYLGRIAADLRRDGRRTTEIVRTGWPSDAIADVAREYRAAFVLMATAGNPQGNRAHLGSVARGVLRHGDAPVLLVRARAALVAQPSAERRAEIARVALPTRPDRDAPRFPVEIKLPPRRPAVAVHRAPIVEHRGSEGVLAHLRAALGRAGSGITQQATPVPV
jgi:nucleotide-binding universal stress UspA family protein